MRWPGGPRVAERSALVALVAAVYSALNVSTLTDELSATGIRNDVPQDAAFPYVRLEAPSEIPWETFGRPGKRILIAVHVFSQYAGDAEALTIASRILSLLQHARPMVTDHAVAAFELEDHTTGAEELLAGVTTSHRVLTFRVRLQQTDGG